MKYIYLLFNFSPKVSLFDKKTKGMYIFYVYFQIATFLKAGVYIYIYIYTYTYVSIYVYISWCFNFNFYEILT